MDFSNETSASGFAIPEAVLVAPLASEFELWAPTAAVGTPWQHVFTTQLVAVLHDWFHSPPLSRRSRRAHAKLNLPMRTAVPDDEREPPVARWRI